VLLIFSINREPCGSGLAREGVIPDVAYYLANNCLMSLNALNSKAFPHGSNKNIVACSPTLG
jgi:hypothetical protein